MFLPAATRWLEVELHGRRQELRVRYSHANRTHTETFPAAMLADKRWHLVAVSLSSTFVQVFIDCQLQSERQIPSIDRDYVVHHRESPYPRQPHLWLGQRDATSAAQFKVSTCTVT